MDDALFSAPPPEHPDAAVAREEITRYYEERLAEAAGALAKAQRLHDARFAELTAWRDRGEITHDGHDGAFVGEATMIASHVMGRWSRAAHGVIYRGGDRAEVDRLDERAKALCRWLTAQGYDLGALAEPPPREPRGRTGRRG